MNILITGGASGLGEALTRRLAQRADFNIFFTFSKSSINAKKLDEEFSNVHSIRCDFKDVSEVNSLNSKIAELDIHVLINNAYHGEPIKSYFHKIQSVDFLNEFKDNIIPTIEISQSAISYFRKKKGGKIITILTSFLVNTAPIGSSVYVANKAYLKKLTKVWASENAAYNITSNSVSPSFMLTNLTSDVDQRVIEQMTENHPLKKLLTPEEVAETVFFLANSSSQINGIDILMNSGTSIQ